MSITGWRAREFSSLLADLGEGLDDLGVVTYDCHVCRQPYEHPDLAACATHDAVGRHHRVEGALELLNRPTEP